MTGSISFVLVLIYAVLTLCSAETDNPQFPPNITGYKHAEAVNRRCKKTVPSLSHIYWLLALCPLPLHLCLLYKLMRAIPRQTATLWMADSTAVILLRTLIVINETKIGQRLQSTIETEANDRCSWSKTLNEHREGRKQCPQRPPKL